MFVALKPSLFLAELTTSPYPHISIHDPIHAATLRSRTRRESQDEIVQCQSLVDCPAHVLANGTGASTSFWTISHAYLSPVPSPPRAVRRALLAAHAYGMLIGACNPMI